MALLEVRDLVVEFPTRRGVLRALDRVSFSIERGEILGVVGESGAGKSLTGAAIVGLLERPGRVASGEVRLGGWKWARAGGRGCGSTILRLSRCGGSAGGGSGRSSRTR